MHSINPSQVVDDVSSCLGDPSLETTQHISSDHMDMCRFSGSDDVEYRKVAAALDHIQMRITEGSAKPVLPGSCAIFFAIVQSLTYARTTLGAQ